MAAGTDSGESPAPTPLEALEAPLLEALSRPPCVVSFSGGRDSSALLALAARLAGREGLPPPVALTLRFDGAPAAEETAWQELVIRELGLADWETRRIGEELAYLGPVHRSVLLRLGSHFAPNAHFALPAAEAAAGGSLITGNGGDHLLAEWIWWRLGDALAGRRRPTPRDAVRFAHASLPRGARAGIARLRPSARALLPPWLSPAGRRRALPLAVAERAGAPWPWRRWAPWRLRRRDLGAICSAVTAIAAWHGAVAHAPLADPRFVAALARAGGNGGLGDRTAAMRRIFGRLLPDRLLARSSKARFGQVFWGPEVRAFAHEWDGGGLARGLVEVDALRRAWLAEEPDARSGVALQVAWLDHRRRGA